MFNKPAPCNEERKAKCNARKDEWLDCVDKMVTKEKKDSDSALKPEYRNNNTLIKMLPLEKLASSLFPFKLFSISFFSQSIEMFPKSSGGHHLQRKKLKENKITIKLFSDYY